MNTTAKVQELVIVIATQSQNPSVVTPDFLKYSGILPDGVEVARPPLYTNQVVQVVLDNNVTITAQPNRLVIAELMDGKTRETIQGPEMACRYVSALPNLEFQAVGINPRGYASFGSADDAQEFISERLISPGPWHNCGQAPMRATVNFFYELDAGQLILNVSEAMVRRQEGDDEAAVLFSGNFNYEFQEETASVDSVRSTINKWQACLDSFTSLVDEQFLGNSITISSSEVAISAAA